MKGYFKHKLSKGPIGIKNPSQPGLYTTGNSILPRYVSADELNQPLTITEEPEKTESPAEPKEKRYEAAYALYDYLRYYSKYVDECRANISKMFEHEADQQLEFYRWALKKYESENASSN